VHLFNRSRNLSHFPQHRQKGSGLLSLDEVEKELEWDQGHTMLKKSLEHGKLKKVRNRISLDVTAVEESVMKGDSR
jgi:hypothetical protein